MGTKAKRVEELTPGDMVFCLNEAGASTFREVVKIETVHWTNKKLLVTLSGFQVPRLMNTSDCVQVEYQQHVKRKRGRNKG